MNTEPYEISHAAQSHTARHSARIHPNWFRPEPIDIIPVSEPERIRDVYDWMQEEMDKRGWTHVQTDRAAGMSSGVTHQRMIGTRRFTHEAAVRYAELFGANVEKVTALPGVAKAGRWY